MNVHRKTVVLVSVVVGWLLGSAGAGVLRADTPLPANFDKTRYMAVSEVRPGMTGYGLSVFKGTKIERFGVEVLSILKNFNPRHDVILVRLHGANLEHTGSIAGMSGSPIYLKDKDGKYRMVGAFAYGWPLMKDPIGGVQPIQYMLGIPKPSTRPATMESGKTPAAKNEPSEHLSWPISQAIFLPGMKQPPASWPFAAMDSTQVNPRLGGAEDSSTRLRPLATPLMTAGLSPQLLSQIGPVLKAYGLTPMQAGAASAPATLPDGEQPPAKLSPGSVLAVPLMTGDMNLTAIGTCTDVIGDRILGFGHPFNNEGEISLPMGTGTINGIIASLTTSFKLGSLVKIDGTLYQDQSVGVAGKMGEAPKMIPIDLDIDYADEPTRHYHFDAALHPQFTPMLASAALAASVTGAHDLPPHHTMRYDLTLDFANGQSLHIANTSADGSVQQLFFTVGGPIAAAIQNPFQRVMPTQIRGTVHIKPQAELADMLAVNVPKLRYHPGETVSGYVTYRPFRAAEATLPIRMKLPEDLSDGQYQLIVSGWQTYLANERQASPFRFNAENIHQVFDVLRDITGVRHDAIYLRLMRKADGIAIGHTALAHLPSSRRQILIGSGRSDITPFLSSIVKIVPTRHVMRGSAQFTLTVERKAHVESAEKTKAEPQPQAQPQPESQPPAEEPAAQQQGEKT